MIRRALLAVIVAATHVMAHRLPVVLAPWSPLLRYSPGVINNQLNASWTPALVGNAKQSTNAFTGDQVVWTRAWAGKEHEPPSVSCEFYGATVKFWGYWNDPDNTSTDRASVELYATGNESVWKRTSGTGSFGGEPVILAEAELANEQHAVKLLVVEGTISLVSVEMHVHLPYINPRDIREAEAKVVNGTTPTHRAPPDSRNPSVIYTVGDTFSTNSFSTIPRGYELPHPWAWKLDPQTNHSIVSQSRGSAIHLSLGRGNIFLRINGTVGREYGQFSVNMFSDALTPGSSTVACTRNSPDHEATLYFATLDPRYGYLITIVNDPDAKGGWMGIHSLELWKGMMELPIQEPSTTTVNDHPTPTVTETVSETSSRTDQIQGAKPAMGPIVGGVVGGVIGLVIIGLAAFVCVRRSGGRKSRSDGEKGAPFEVDDKISENGDAATDPTSNPNPKAKGRPARPIIRNLRRGKHIPHRRPLKHGNNPAAPGSSRDPASTDETDNGADTASGSNAPLGPLRIVCQEEDAGVLELTSPNTARRLGPPIYSARPDTLLTLNPTDGDDATDVRTTTTTPNAVDTIETAGMIDSRQSSCEQQSNADKL